MSDPAAIESLAEFLGWRLDGVVRRSGEDRLEIWLLGSHNGVGDEPEIAAAISEWASGQPEQSCLFEIDSGQAPALGSSR